ncbi:hypothetical protein FRC06_009776 [Ceratobasidium sp. 370]|nr:hypothetical protein FRC06_009776 [Ceratobasidium sp. 370]
MDMTLTERSPDMEIELSGTMEIGNASLIELADPLDCSGIPELGEDDVWVRRHPASGIASSLRTNPTTTTTLHPATPASTPPTWPFQTLADLKQTEVFIKHKATNSHMNDQLALEQAKPQNPEDPLTLQTAANVHAVLQLAVPADSQFKVTDFTTHIHGQDYVHRLHGTPIRLWEESYHGDDFWNLQNKVGSGTRILYIQLYMDATKVSLFGGVKVWPVYMWLGNIPSVLRRKWGIGGGVLVAYIPIVRKKQGLSSSHMAELCVKVYHQAMMMILETIKTLMHHGEYFRCEDGKVYFFLGVIAVISADYEELAKIAAILGALSGFPCPICLVPRALQGDLTGIWPLRTHQGTSDVLRRARKVKTIKFQKLILGEQSLRKTTNAFIKSMGSHFSIYQAVAADPLHQIELGVFGHHMWPWVLDHQLSNQGRAELDERFMAIPRYPDLKHFPNGVTDLENVQGKEYAIILRMLPPLVEDLITAQHAKLISQTLRSLACIHLLSKLTTHSDNSLALLSSEIEHFGALSQARLHTIALNSLGEGIHPKSKAAFKRSNKQPGFEEQMLRTHLEQQAMLAIRSRIAHAEAAALGPPSNPEELNMPNPPQTESNYELGSKLRCISTSDFITRQKGVHPSHVHFERDLKTFLYQNVKGLSRRRDFLLRDLPSLEGTRLTPYQLIRLVYISLEDSTERLDIVRTNPEWRGEGPRHDCVMIQGQADEGVWFARLLSVFSLEFRGQILDIAHVKRFRTLPKRSKTTGYIQLEDQGVFNFVLIDIQ